MDFDEIPNGFLISLSYDQQKISTAEVIEGVNKLLNLVLTYPGKRISFF